MDRQNTISIYFPDEGVTIEPRVSCEGALKYRLLEQPMLVENVTIFDLIEVKKRDANTFEFLRVIEKSGWHSWHFTLTQEQAQSGVFDPVLRKVEHFRGRWERELGGCLLISLPPGATYDPTPDILGHTV